MKYGISYRESGTSAHGLFPASAASDTAQLLISCLLLRCRAKFERIDPGGGGIKMKPGAECSMLETIQYSECDPAMGSRNCGDTKTCQSIDTELSKPSSTPFQDNSFEANGADTAAEHAYKEVNVEHSLGVCRNGSWYSGVHSTSLCSPDLKIDRGL